MNTVPAAPADQPDQPPLLLRLVDGSEIAAPSLNGTYANDAPILRAHGLREVIFLPSGQKWPPPTGYTGKKKSRDVSDEDVKRWTETNGDDNPALVFEDGQLAIDSDNYAKGERQAGEARQGLLALEERVGCDFPPTICVFHRDDGSGKFFYLGTGGVEYHGKVVPGVEVLQRTHRYANLGFNPDTGQREQWGYGSPTTDITPVDGPVGPDRWARIPEALEAELIAEDNGKIPTIATTEQAQEWLDGMPEGPLSYYVGEALRGALDDLTGRNGSRHDNVRNRVRRLVQYGAAGLAGAPDALNLIEQQLARLRAVDPERSGDAGEFDRMLEWAAKRANPDMFVTHRALDRTGGRIPMTRLGDGQAAETPADGAAPGIFTVMEPSEWAQPVPPTEFLIRAVLSTDTFGVNAGPKKSLKTHDNQALAFAVATGTSLYRNEKFPVLRPGRVLYIVGEGGVNPVRRTLQRMGKAYETDMPELMRDPNSPLVVAWGAAPIDGEPFRDELKAMLDRYQPELVLIESFYNFHPADVQAGDLYQRGQIIDDYHKFVRRECEGATSLLTDHYRSTAAKSHDLDNISMAGQAENADSWITRFPRKPADVDAGDFYLHTAFSSRQWGGTEWHVDWHLGHFDHDLGHHIGEISWDVSSAHDDAKAGGKLDRTGVHMVQVVRDKEFELTMTQVADAVGGNKQKALETVDMLVRDGTLIVEERDRTEGRRVQKRRLVGLAAPALRASLVPGAGTSQETGSR